MAKLVASLNMTLDGYCDHTSLTADDEILRHYASLLDSAEAVLYGRITYQLMEFWPTVLKNPTGNKLAEEFAVAIDRIPKVVFSNSLKSVDWKTARIATSGLKEEVSKLKQQLDGDILVSSRSLIVALANHGLLDEYQICVHPVVAGSGLPLFKDISERTVLKLRETKKFSGGAVTLYYQAG